MWRPAAVDPVKETLSTPGWVTRCSPTSRSAGTTFRTPAGTPASSHSSANTNALTGVSGADLSTIVEPDASVGANFNMVMNSGTFHGTMPATTPTGSLRTTTGPSIPARTSSNGYDSVSPVKKSSAMWVAPIWPKCENRMGAPTSWVIRLARSSARSTMSPWSRRMIPARSCADISAHGPWFRADRAASTARSTSAWTASGVEPTGSSVAGLTTVKVLDDAGSTHSPPM